MCVSLSTIFHDVLMRSTFDYARREACAVCRVARTEVEMPSGATLAELIDRLKTDPVL